jgi:hypothetical protein
MKKSGRTDLQVQALCRFIIRLISCNWFPAPYRAKLERRLRLQAISRSRIMGKAKETSKETKKQPAKTPKEKKAAKQAKKHAAETTPLVTR